MKRAAVTTFVIFFILAPAAALAHPGHDGAGGLVHGFVHPLTGIDTYARFFVTHILAHRLCILPALSAITGFAMDEGRGTIDEWLSSFAKNRRFPPHRNRHWKNISIFLVEPFKAVFPNIPPTQRKFHPCLHFCNFRPQSPPNLSLYKSNIR